MTSAKFDAMVRKHKAELRVKYEKMVEQQRIEQERARAAQAKVQQHIQEQQAAINEQRKRGQLQQAVQTPAQPTPSTQSTVPPNTQTPPVIQPVSGPVTEPVTPPVTPPVTQPVTPPVTQPAAQPTAETVPTTQAEINSQPQTTSQTPDENKVMCERASICVCCVLSVHGFTRSS